MPGSSHGRRRQAWDHFAGALGPSGIATALDAVAVELLATSYGQFLDAAAKVVQGGPVWIGKSKDGSLPKCVASPWVKIMDRSWKQIKEMLTEFGMTPSSRLIGDRPPDAGDDFDAFVRSKR